MNGLACIHWLAVNSHLFDVSSIRNPAFQEMLVAFHLTDDLLMYRFLLFHHREEWDDTGLVEFGFIEEFQQFIISEPGKGGWDEREEDIVCGKKDVLREQGDVWWAVNEYVVILILEWC